MGTSDVKENSPHLLTVGMRRNRHGILIISCADTIDACHDTGRPLANRLLRVAYPAFVLSL
jgi:hypothetical protein